MRLEGKVAVVTGGARGIGRATVEKFLAEGARVVFLDIDQDAGAATAADLIDAAYPPRFLRCDVTREDEVAAAIGETFDAHEQLDILVNNAGINAYFDATTMTERDWEQVFAVDLKGAWLAAKHAIPLMRPRGGAIVNVASIHAFMTTAGMFPYAAAKSGLVGLTRSLALDYGPDQIRVNAICPGWTRTYLVQEWLDRQPNPGAAERQVTGAHPLRRIASPAEIAAVICFLASDEASFVTGAAWLVDGGLSARFA
jgi:NAD(P)-dependent dehydrogenase (short-subunit alcohol dehydrogenase family)